MSAWPYNVEGFRRQARRRLPKAVFDYVEGGAEDEQTLRRNRLAFSEYGFMPRVLVDVHECSLKTTICGVEVASPILLAPTGLIGMVHPDGELAAVRAAARHGTIAVVSSSATYSVEELTADGPSELRWFQLYSYRDRGFYGALVDRAAAAGFTGLCLTVDCAVGGNRERDLANHLTVRPLRITWGNAIDAAVHPRWLSGILRERRVVAKLNIEESGQTRPPLTSLLGSARNSAANVVKLLPSQVTWEDFEWIRDRWHGPLAVKGVVNSEDAAHAVALGADAVIVSNHGGRQLDGVPGTLDVLPGICDAVGDRLDVILDGGVRRGGDVVKALCLGAKACMVGRPWVYGLASGGTAGVDAVLGILEAEVRRTLALLGQPDVQALDAGYLTAQEGATARATAKRRERDWLEEPLQQGPQGS